MSAVGPVSEERIEEGHSAAGATDRSERDPGDAETPLADRVAVVAATYLTESPDVRGLEALWEALAARAEVDLDSVREKPDGSVEGRVSFGEAELQATFTLRDDDYQVELATSLDGPGPMRRREITLALRDDGGDVPSVASGVQYHPATSRPSSERLAEGQESYVGWHAFVSRDAGTRMVPSTMRAGADGVSWIIGQPSSSDFEPFELEWEWDTSRYAAWADLLRPHRR